MVPTSTPQLAKIAMPLSMWIPAAFIFTTDSAFRTYATTLSLFFSFWLSLSCNAFRAVMCASPLYPTSCTCSSTFLFRWLNALRSVAVAARGTRNPTQYSLEADLLQNTVQIWLAWAFPFYVVLYECSESCAKNFVSRLSKKILCTNKMYSTTYTAVLTLLSSQPLRAKASLHVLQDTRTSSPSFSNWMEE